MTSTISCTYLLENNKCLTGVITTGRASTADSSNPPTIPGHQDDRAPRTTHQDVELVDVSEGISD